MLVKFAFANNFPPSELFVIASLSLSPNCWAGNGSGK